MRKFLIVSLTFLFAVNTVNIYSANMRFAKLSSAITESSLWSYSKETRILFVSMLARADPVGFVEASASGLARLANLTVEETKASIEDLESPDPESKDLQEHPENEGRRIIKVERGWIIVNYEDYRNRVSDEERREYMRNYMKNYRRVGKLSVNSGKQKCASLTQGEVEVELEGEKDNNCSDRSKPVKATDINLRSAEAIYAEYPKKVARKDAIKAISNALKVEPASKLLERTKAFAAAVATWPVSERQFIPHPATWFNRGSYDDDPQSWQKRNAKTNERPRNFGPDRNKGTYGEQRLARQRELAAKMAGPG